MPQLYMAQRLSQLLEEHAEREYRQLLAFPEASANTRPGGDATWSPQEELGHLIDSAVNNHVRFVNASIAREFRGPSYAQNDWVQAHGYQEWPWQSIITLWFQQNGILAEVLNRIPDDKLQTLCFIGSGDGVTLEYLIEDYMLHMQHHVDHLLGREHVTAYPPV